MAKIPLTNGLSATVDDEDAVRLSAHRWVGTKRLHTAYAKTAIEGRTVYMHRLVLEAPKGTQVDHINHDGLDNRKGNLRLCGYVENQRNRRPRRDGHTGVHCLASGKWRAHIGVAGKTKSLGHFDTESEAVEARKAGEEFYWVMGGVISPTPRVQINKNRSARQRNNSSGHRGVFVRGTKWGAFLIVDGKRTHLGFFSSFEEAVEARLRAEDLHWTD